LPKETKEQKATDQKDRLAEEEFAKELMAEGQLVLAIISRGGL
jgi:hypothetical protein